MANEFKAIETVYNGYRFRSRLEARWAVFFDTIGIKYEYEKEGYETKDGKKYLPDFFLPNVFGGCYAEVKPSAAERLDDVKKAVSVICGGLEKNLVILGSIPNITEDSVSGIWCYPICYFHSLDRTAYCRYVALRVFCHDKNGVSQYKAVFVTDLYEEKSKEIILTDLAAKSIIWDGIGLTELEGQSRPFDIKYWETETNSERLFAANAYTSARMARFEFGETPSPKGGG